MCRGGRDMKRNYPGIKLDIITVLVVTLLGRSMTIPTISQATSSQLNTAIAMPTECIAAWEVVSSPSPGNNGQLFGVAAISPSDVWAVGYYSISGPTSTLVKHWDGIVWSVVPSPNPGSSNQLY